jgi:hypothetical protein
MNLRFQQVNVAVFNAAIIYHQFISQSEFTDINAVGIDRGLFESTIS